MGSIEQDTRNELQTLGIQIGATSLLLGQLMEQSALAVPTWDESTPAEFPEVGKHAGQIQKIRCFNSAHTCLMPLYLRYLMHFVGVAVSVYHQKRRDWTTLLEQ